MGEDRKAAPTATEKKTSDKATSSASKKKTSEQAPAEPKMQYHTVAAGDTFYSISKRYNISLEDLIQMNGLDKSSPLKLGQKLVVGKE